MPTYPLTIPFSYHKIMFRLKTAAGITRSEFSLQSQVQLHQGDMWEAEISFRTMPRSTAEPIIAQLMRLDGIYGTFLLGPTGDAATPQGAGGGTPVINGAGQTGKSLVTSGWPNSTTVLKAGDWISFGVSAEYLYKVAADVISNGSGAATIELVNRIKESTTNGDTLTVTSPKGIFRLQESQIQYDINEHQFYDIETLKAVEAV